MDSVYWYFRWSNAWMGASRAVRIGGSTESFADCYIQMIITERRFLFRVVLFCYAKWKTGLRASRYKYTRFEVWETDQDAMQRSQFRHPRPGSGPRAAGFRSPPPAFDRTGSMFPSPPWAFSTPPPPFGPRFGQCSPNTPPREFSGNRGGGGKYFNGQSPAQTPHRSSPSPRGAPFRRSPYESPRRHSGYQVVHSRSELKFKSN